MEHPGNKKICVCVCGVLKVVVSRIHKLSVCKCDILFSAYEKCAVDITMYFKSAVVNTHFAYRQTSWGQKLRLPRNGLEKS